MGRAEGRESSRGEADVIDGCVFHDWSSLEELFPYLSEAWRDVIARPGDLGGIFNATSNWLFREPRTSAEEGAGQPARSFNDLDTMRNELLDRGGVSKVVLGYNDGLLTTASPYHYLASALVSATNDWTVDRWLSQDDRVYGMILVLAGVPDEAVAEIRRLSSNEQMVAVALGANGLGNLFGHPAYHPIYAAAEEVGLPLVLQVGSDAATDLAAEPIAGGLPTTYGEYRALSVQPIMTHLASMITEGVFEKYPRLQVLVVGGGLTWIAPWLWRLDYWFKSLERESPWMRKRPSEYFFGNVRVATYALERTPPASRLRQALTALPELEGKVLYTSGAPSSERVSPNTVRERVEEGWHEAVFHKTAEEFYRWPSETAGRAAATKRRKAVRT